MTSSSVDSPGLASDLANLPRVQISKTTWIKGWLILPTFTLLTHLASQVSPQKLMGGMQNLFKGL